jgi:hypothetical protein
MAADWTAVLGQYWSCPWLRAESDVAVATEELRETFRGCTPDNKELVSAIRWLAGPENQQDRCPTLRELVRAISILRKRDRPAMNTDIGPDARVAKAKSAMLRAATFGERWDLLCKTCHTDDEFRVAEAWAVATWGQQWVKSVAAIKGEYMREWREARVRLIRSMAERRDTTSATVEAAWA